MIRFASAAIAAIFLSVGAEAAAVLDQSYLTDASGSYSDINPGVDTSGTQYDALQTVTAGLTGKLTGLKLQLFNDTTIGTVQISIIGNITIDPLSKAISGDQSAAISLASTLLPTTSQFRAGTLLSIDTSALDVFLTSGEAFGIFVRLNETPQFSGISWGSTFQGGSGGYTGGDAYFAVNGDARAEATDAGFQTFVDTSLQPPSSDVPEPASWAMMAMGFGLLGGGLRRKSWAARAA